jgi:hypothetical protein
MKEEFNTYNTLPPFLRIKRGKKESIINKIGQQEQSQTGVHPAQAGIERLMLVLTTGYRQQQATRVTGIHEEDVVTGEGGSRRSGDRKQKQGVVPLFLSLGSDAWRQVNKGMSKRCLESTGCLFGSTEKIVDKMVAIIRGREL